MKASWADGPMRACEGRWNTRTYTATGCDRPALRRFRRLSRDARTPFKHAFVYLCAKCAKGER